MRQRVPETTVGTATATWLKEEGWEVYPEVVIGRTGRVADIVAVRAPLVWIIECKVALSLEVITQAMTWHGLAHYRSVAVLEPKRASRGGGHRILRDYGIGLFEIGENFRNSGVFEAHHVLSPRFNRKVRADITRGSLHELHKEWAVPGQASRRGGVLTPFARTSRAVQDYVRAHPGCSLKELMSGIEHHYRTESTARAMIPKWIESGVIPTIRVEREARKLRFYGGERGI